MATHNLHIPLTESDIVRLRAGDLVYLSGRIITARDRAHGRMLQAADRGGAGDGGEVRGGVPFDLEGAVIYHCGPIMAGTPGSWKVVAAGPTTSARLNAETAELLKRFRVRAVIGKGGMSISVTEAMRDRCVYLAATGGCAATAADCVDSVCSVHWIDLGMPEAVWVLDVLDFGPLVVGIDAHGRNLYHEVQARARDRLSAIAGTSPVEAQ